MPYLSLCPSYTAKQRYLAGLNLIDYGATPTSLLLLSIQESDNNPDDHKEDSSREQCHEYIAEVEDELINQHPHPRTLHIQSGEDDESVNPAMVIFVNEGPDFFGRPSANGIEVKTVAHP